MKINRVTVSGASDDVDILDILNFSTLIPCVEWGILLSKSQSGNGRFPTIKWIQTLDSINMITGNHVHLSGHLCGKWMRDFVGGTNSFREENHKLWQGFERIQINIGSMPVQPELLAKSMLEDIYKPYIIQTNPTRDISLVHQLRNEFGLDVSCLFDASGGEGIETKDWPKPVEHVKCGYSGGLGGGVGELAHKLGEINKVAGGIHIWIDAEGQLRTDDKLDLVKVKSYIFEALKWEYYGDK